jgi:hypothetical protein
MSRDTFVAVDAGGVLVDRMLGFVAKRSPGEQAKRGDRRLDDARALMVEDQALIDPSDLQVVAERIT